MVSYELSSNDQLLAGTAPAGVAVAIGVAGAAGAATAGEAAAFEAGAGRLLFTQASKSAWLTTFTSIGMKLWSVPQSWEHWP